MEIEESAAIAFFCSGVALCIAALSRSIFSSKPPHIRLQLERKTGLRARIAAMNAIKTTRSSMPAWDRYLADGASLTGPAGAPGSSGQA